MKSGRRIRIKPVVEVAVAKTGLRLKAYFPAKGFRGYFELSAAGMRVWGR